ncbi:MAG: hypothetical protein NTY22_01995 [Proteobacteria bacterium]|nr:hypothetical protein [Pseudomonadota bacterium]
MFLNLRFKAYIILIGMCSCSGNLSKKQTVVSSYETFSEKQSLEMWNNLKRVEIGKEKIISDTLKGVKLEFTNTKGETSSILLLCKGMCKPAPCGIKPWRYGCFGTDKCERKEFKLKAHLTGYESTNKWLYSFTKDEEYLIQKQ